MPEITPDIPYSEPAKCYDLCHLSDNLTELITDSLSKYDYDKCPDRESIAEEVRSEPSYCGPEGSLNQANVSTSQIYKENSYAENTKINYTSPDGQVLKTFTINKEIASLPIHNKKLNDLKEVLAIYKSQPMTHSFGHHSTIHR